MDRKIGMSIAAGRPQMALVLIPGEGFLLDVKEPPIGQKFY